MSDTRFDPPTGSLGSRFLTGTVFTLTAQAAKLAIQFGSVIILSRLLFPGDFGVVAMAGPIVAFVALFADLGLNQAAVQRRNLSHAEANALFWWTLAIGCVLALLILSISPLVALFYRDARAGYICAAFSPLMLIGALGSQHQSLLSRTMQFGRLALIEVSGAAVGLAATIGSAVAGAGYWSLVIGALFSTAVPAAMAWLAMPWRPSAPAGDPAIRAMLGFGSGITGFNLANFFSRNLDNIMIGRLWGARQLGFYDRAYKLLLFPLAQITAPVARVMLPTLSRLAPDPHGYRRAFLHVVNAMLLVTTPGVVVLIATGPVLIPLLLGARWQGIVPIFLVLGFAGLIQPLNNPSGWLFITQGRTREYAIWGVVGAMVDVAAFVVGLPYGAYGVAFAYAVAEYLRTPFLWWLVSRSGPVGIRQIAAVTAPHIIAAVINLMLLHLASGWLVARPLLAIPAGMVVAYALAFGMTMLFPVSRHGIVEAWRLFDRTWAGRRRRMAGATA